MAALVGAALGVAGAVSSARAGRAARSASRREAEAERLATEERVRRLGIQREQVVGAQRAGAAAAGIDVRSATILDLTEETIREFEKQEEFVRRAGAFAADAAEIRGRSARASAFASAAGSLVSAINIAEEADWWGLGKK